ncbi:MAG: PspA/IM30 family protein [Treponema sp.]|jgi:phage shock protein A|nr:PspA/IM30 family protein [Treponema sp.]
MADPALVIFDAVLYTMVMEQSPEDLRGMGAADAKEYIFHYITTLKLTEKKYGELAGEHEKWLSRVDLARSGGKEDLARAAQGEADKLRSARDALAGEIADLKAQIQRMRDQLPGLAARERSVDPDLLEQELLIALGADLADDGKADLDRRFEAAEADAALEALKAKMNPNEKP